MVPQPDSRPEALVRRGRGGPGEADPGAGGLGGRARRPPGRARPRALGPRVGRGTGPPGGDSSRPGAPVPAGQRAHGGGQPAAGGEHRQEVHVRAARPLHAGPHPGGLPGPHPRLRKVRPIPWLQVLHLRHVVDKAGHLALDCRPVAHHPAARAHSRADQLLAARGGMHAGGARAQAHGQGARRAAQRERGQAGAPLPVRAGGPKPGDPHRPRQGGRGALHPPEADCRRRRGARGLRGALLPAGRPGGAPLRRALPPRTRRPQASLRPR
mmetsp:Transcript_8827/g.30024  ORF Transcript_8827/g.30024 Transcript_8827/m.30024 type:complete len:269 (+) Transcript_8827:282-1088(+)